MRRTFQFDDNTPPLCRLGLATRGNTHLQSADVRYAVERGVNYLNWCGRPDGLSRAVADMGAEREKIVLAWQLKSSTASGAERELEDALRELNTDYIDVVTFYYVESEGEWRDIASKGGAYEAMSRARKEGKVRFLGLTSHQRNMAARIAVGDLRASEQIESRPLDMLMLRYNAAHRGCRRGCVPFDRSSQYSGGCLYLSALGCFDEIYSGRSSQFYTATCKRMVPLCTGLSFCRYCHCSAQ